MHEILYKLISYIFPLSSPKNIIAVKITAGFKENFDINRGNEADISIIRFAEPLN